MIPIALTIKGLYSYQQETTIDFTNLTAAGLFGIFGAVGSGKSTILEAITFALYGETERLNSRDSRSYNMMNLKSNEMLIDFTFMGGVTQEKYRLTVGCRRNKKRYSETTAFERKAYQLVDNDWQPTAKTATEILGLSYDNFKRTVIIPQGKFQEFLQLKDTERVQMLKEIFNLEKFELSPQVVALSKENDLKISNTEGRMQGLPIYDEEAVLQKGNEIAVLQKQYDLHSVELRKKQDEEKEFDLLKGLFDDMNIKTQHFNQLKENEPAISLLEKEVSEYENCEKLFRHLIDNRDNSQKNIAATEENFEKQKKESDTTEAAIKNGEALLAELQNSFAAKETLLQKAEELGKIISIKNLVSSLVTLAERTTKGQTLITDKEAELSAVKDEIKNIQQSIESKEKDLPDTELLLKLNNWFIAKNQLDNEVKKAVKEKNDSEEKLPEIIQSIEDKVKHFPKEIAFSSMPQTMEVIQKKTSAATENYDTVLQDLKDKLAHLQLSQKLEEFAKNLHEGDECPLCGSVHHPHILSVKNVADEMESIRRKMKDIEKNKTLLQQCLVALATVFADYENQKKAVIQKQENLQKAEAGLQQFISTFLFENYTIADEELIVNQLQDIQLKTNDIKNLCKQKVGKEAGAESLLKTINDYKTRIEKLNLEKAKSESEVSILSSQILLHKIEEEIINETATIESAIEQLKKNHKDITKNYEQVQATLLQNHTQQGTLKGKMDEMRNQMTKGNELLLKLNEDIQLLLFQNNYSYEAQVKAILEKEINAALEKEKIATYRQQLHTANTQLEEAMGKVTGKKYDSQLHTTATAAIAQLLTELKKQTEDLATLKGEVQRLKQQMEERKTLQAELDKLNERSANLKTLANLFRGSGFVSYVSSVYLQNLVNTANQKFYKMTRQKLQLELNEENAFQVRDFFNNGEVRSVKTLSGGQTFQAALSLALALADNIQHLTRSAENFFFMDEGFGSLDKDSLNIVFETLRGLKKENRIVGIISHVEEMQQEIDVNLKIVNEIDKGSLVYFSWK